MRAPDFQTAGGAAGLTDAAPYLAHGGRFERRKWWQWFFNLAESAWHRRIFVKEFQLAPQMRQAGVVPRRNVAGQ